MPPCPLFHYGCLICRAIMAGWLSSHYSCLTCLSVVSLWLAVCLLNVIIWLPVCYVITAACLLCHYGCLSAIPLWLPVCCLTISAGYAHLSVNINFKLDTCFKTSIRLYPSLPIYLPFYLIIYRLLIHIYIIVHVHQATCLLICCFFFITTPPVPIYRRTEICLPSSPISSLRFTHAAHTDQPIRLRSIYLYTYICVYAEPRYRLPSVCVLFQLEPL